MLLIAVLVALPVNGAGAARARDKLPVGQPDALQLPSFNKTVQRVQRALADAGYYRGAVNGHFNEATNQAIRTYQRREGLRQSGIASSELAAHIETSTKVQSLLRQLQRQRLSKMDEARAALLARPETRDLISTPAQRNKPASAQRDPSECFEQPTPQCLLDEASQNAIAIFKSELRNWALGEILVAQAKAGLVSRAMDTVRLIGDPRLIMVALRDIATAQATAGRSVEALAAANIIPDATKRLEALAAIAAIEVRRGNMDGAVATAGQLLDGLAQIEDDLKRFSLAASALTTLARAGKGGRAQRELDTLNTAAHNLKKSGLRSAALRHVANALAETGKPAQALVMLDDLPDVSEHTPVLVSAATAQARAGHAQLAISTAASIEAVRYRAVVLTRIALAQANAGDSPGGRQTLDVALLAAQTIKRPFARAYAYERITLALMKIETVNSGQGFDQAISTAMLIKDNKLRAQTLWTLAIGRALAGDVAGSQQTTAMAERATAEIKSPLSRAWMFSEIALAHLAKDREQPAWVAFERALAIARDIDGAWGSARALAKLASTLIELSEYVEK